jgi:hypothetical protein
LADTPRVLVGTKLDLREKQTPDPNSGKFEPVTPEMVYILFFLCFFKQIKSINKINNKINN